MPRDWHEVGLSALFIAAMALSGHLLGCLHAGVQPVVNRHIEDLKRLAEDTAEAFRKHPHAMDVRVHWRCALLTMQPSTLARNIDTAEYIIDHMLGYTAKHKI